MGAEGSNRQQAMARPGSGPQAATHNERVGMPGRQSQPLASPGPRGSPPQCTSLGAMRQANLGAQGSNRQQGMAPPGQQWLRTAAVPAGSQGRCNRVAVVAGCFDRLCMPAPSAQGGWGAAENPTPPTPPLPRHPPLITGLWPRRGAVWPPTNGRCWAERQACRIAGDAVGPMAACRRRLDVGRRRGHELWADGAAPQALCRHCGRPAHGAGELKCALLPARGVRSSA